MLLTLMTGCFGGKKDNRPHTVAVQGGVKLKGAPVGDAIITFLPAPDKKGAVGRTDATGRYTMTTFSPGDGVMPGNYNVVIMKYEKVDESKIVDGKSPELKNLLPEKYSHPGTSKLSVDIPETGPITFDFDL